MNMIMKLLFCLVFLNLFDCSKETLPIKTTESANNFNLQNSIQLSASKPESIFKQIGLYSNAKDNGEHTVGYFVKLWQQDNKIYGLISGTDTIRLSGDPPVGLLENVQFDSKTKKFSFQAKLTLGLFSDKNHSNIPSKDIYEFKGFLTNKSLQGILVIKNELCSNKCLKTKSINLQHSKKWLFDN